MAETPEKNDTPPRVPPLEQDGSTLPRLVSVMNRLLAPGGCPWDREQTLATLKPYLVEETYEVLEAIEDGDPAEHRDELGDLLLQIVFQAALRAREATPGSGGFGVDDVVGAIVTKLVRRHPHVFGDKTVSGSEEVLSQWADIKAAERKEKTSEEARRTLAGVPRALPALLRALRTGEKAARAGFDWPDAEGARKKVEEELGELDRARAEGDRARIEEELGDLLFATVSLARLLGLDPEEALGAATRKFERRFRAMEDALASEGREVRGTPMERLDQLWEHAKRGEQK